MLETLERANLFLVPLDDRRRWYRYHHLFADVLRARLLDEHPDRVAELHRRASDWYEAHGDRPEAIRHAMAGRGRRAGRRRSSSSASPALRRARQEATAAPLARRPAGRDLRRTGPCSAIALVGARMVTGDSTGVEALARRASSAGSDPTVAPTTGRGRPRRVRPPPRPGRHVPRRRSPCSRGDPRGHHRPRPARAVDLAPRTTTSAGPRPPPSSGSRTGAGGDLDGRRPRLRRGHRRPATAAGHLADVLGCSLALADIQIAQGRLGDAMRTLRAGLDLAREPAGRCGAPPTCTSAWPRCSSSATTSTPPPSTSTPADELGEHAGLPQHPYRWRVGEARLRAAEGDLDGALELLDEAEQRLQHRLLARGPAGPGRHGPAAARRAATSRRRGDGRSSRPHRRRRTQLPPRVRAPHPRPGAPRPTGRRRSTTRPGCCSACSPRPRTGGRTGAPSRSSSLLAARPQARGDDAEALAALERALALAEPEGYVRVFLDEGPPMAALLRGRRAARPAARRRPPSSLAATVGGAPAPPQPAAAWSTSSATGSSTSSACSRSELTGPRSPRELVGVAQHRADPHQEHLREARRDQPPGSRAPGRRARPVGLPAEDHHLIHHMW